MNDFMDHRESERLVRSLAGRVQRRLRSVPQGFMSFEDIEQELWVAWCKARDRYDPAQGIPWAAYLMRGMKNHINRHIEKHIERFEAQTFALSLDYSYDDDGDGEKTLADIIPSDAPRPASIAEGESNWRAAMSVMSERSKIFVAVLRAQPPSVLNEVMVAQDKAEHAKKIGAPFVNPRRITAAMVFDLMGASRIERANITKEVKQLGLRLSA